MRRGYRPSPRRSRQDADLFYADLMGEAPHRSRQARVRRPPMPSFRYEASASQDISEAVPSGGRGAFRHEPLGGIAGDNVAARWNVDAATVSGATIDIVVHLHGYSSQADDANFLAGKTTAAGVDLLAGDGSVRVRSSQPTLVLVPRGRHASGATWLFDRLRDKAAFDALVDAGLAWLCVSVLRGPAGSTLRRGRLTLAAHSGGGAGMNVLLAAGVNPDELMCFDSMYGGGDPIERWALARIASADAPRSGLRVFYTGCSGPLAAYPGGRWVTGRDKKVSYEQPGSWSYRNGAWTVTTTEISARRLNEALKRALEPGDRRRGARTAVPRRKHVGRAQRYSWAVFTAAPGKHCRGCAARGGRAARVEPPGMRRQR